ncbi:MAG: MoaD/ThiS family protein [Planctomycetota bacterium]|nr:MoaD/ThiS family protein [Planctomycetota bacterium]MCX8040845.1 MoaD/ThiS family protein [Planctomycetota bacterium]MDW8372296.1 MoaD/ThiS family protein [Planctomycetota bacterium]
MPITVRIPTVLRHLTGGSDSVSVQAGSVAALIEALESAHPGIKARLCDESGALRRHINVFVGEEDIRFLEGLQTALKDGDTVDIVPAIAGGA